MPLKRLPPKALSHARRGIEGLYYNDFLKSSIISWVYLDFSSTLSLGGFSMMQGTSADLPII